jgi:hypothetical protein
MQYSTMKEIKPYIQRFRTYRFRARRIFMEIRKRPQYKYWSEIIIFNTLFISLNELKLAYSRRELITTFDLVSKEDYLVEDKKEILKPFLRKAKQKSIF